MGRVGRWKRYIEIAFNRGPFVRGQGTSPHCLNKTGEAEGDDSNVVLGCQDCINNVLQKENQ